MQRERKYPRKEMNRNMLCFTEYDSTEGVGRSYFFATLLNVSKDGAGLETEQNYDRDDEIWLNGVDAVSECLSGKVIWSRKAGNKYNLGLHFPVS